MSIRAVAESYVTAELRLCYVSATRMAHLESAALFEGLEDTRTAHGRAHGTSTLGSGAGVARKGGRKGADRCKRGQKYDSGAHWIKLFWRPSVVRAFYGSGGDG